MHKEIEIKLEIDSLDKIRKLLPNHGWEMKYSVNEIVAYFDDESDSWMNKGITIRLKKLGDKNIFTVKQKTGTGEYRIANENEVEISSFEKMIDILTTFNLKPVFQYSKDREHWISKKGVIELDSLPQINKSFIEVESDETAKVEEIIQELNLGSYPRNSKSYPDIVRENIKK